MESFTLLQLLSVFSGSTYIVIGERRDEGDYYWPTVERHKWLYQGRVIEWFKSHDIELDGKEVKFVSDLRYKESEFAVRILI